MARGTRRLCALAVAAGQVRPFGVVVPTSGEPRLQVKGESGDGHVDRQPPWPNAAKPGSASPACRRILKVGGSWVGFPLPRGPPIFYPLQRGLRRVTFQFDPAVTTLGWRVASRSTAPQPIRGLRGARSPVTAAAGGSAGGLKGGPSLGRPTHTPSRGGSPPSCFHRRTQRRGTARAASARERGRRPSRVTGQPCP